MPPRQKLHRHRNKQVNALRKALAEFQQTMCDVLRESMVSALDALILANQHPPIFFQEDDSIFDEEVEEIDDENHYQAVGDLYNKFYGAPIYDVYDEVDPIFRLCDGANQICDGSDHANPIFDVYDEYDIEFIRIQRKEDVNLGYVQVINKIGEENEDTYGYKDTNMSHGKQYINYASGKTDWIVFSPYHEDMVDHMVKRYYSDLFYLPNHLYQQSNGQPPDRESKDHDPFLRREKTFYNEIDGDPVFSVNEDELIGAVCNDELTVESFEDSSKCDQHQVTKRKPMLVSRMSKHGHTLDFGFGYTRFDTTSGGTLSHLLNPLIRFLRQLFSHQFALKFFLTPIFMLKLQGHLLSLSGEPMTDLVDILVVVMVPHQAIEDRGEESSFFSRYICHIGFNSSVFQLILAWLMMDDINVGHYLRHKVVSAWLRPRARWDSCICWLVLKAVIDFPDAVLICGALFEISYLHYHQFLKSSQRESFFEETMNNFSIEWGLLFNDGKSYVDLSWKLASANTICSTCLAIHANTLMTCLVILGAIDVTYLLHHHQFGLMNGNIHFGEKWKHKISVKWVFLMRGVLFSEVFSLYTDIGEVQLVKVQITTCLVSFVRFFMSQDESSMASKEEFNFLWQPWNHKARVFLSLTSTIVPVVFFSITLLLFLFPRGVLKCRIGVLRRTKWIPRENAYSQWFEVVCGSSKLLFCYCSDFHVVCHASVFRIPSCNELSLLMWVMRQEATNYQDTWCEKLKVLVTMDPIFHLGSQSERELAEVRSSSCFVVLYPRFVSQWGDLMAFIIVSKEEALFLYSPWLIIPRSSLHHTITMDQGALSPITPSALWFSFNVLLREKQNNITDKWNALLNGALVCHVNLSIHLYQVQLGDVQNFWCLVSFARFIVSYPDNHELTMISHLVTIWTAM